MSLRDDLEGLQLEGNVGKLIEWLAENGVGLEAVGGAKLYQGFHKDAEGDAQVVDMVSLELSPAWTDGPKWPLIAPVDPVVVRAPKSRDKPKKATGTRTIALLPDAQIGFWRDMDTGELEPMHDIAAMDVALQVTRDADPDGITNLGDLLDLAEFSKYGHEPTLDQTTMPAIRIAHRFLALQRSHTRADENILLEGNHDKRLKDSVTKWNRAALYLKKADATPDDWPVFSIPNLLCLDDLGVQYVDGYPAGQHWLRDDFVVEHGRRVASGSSTAAKYAKEAPGVSVAFGHAHRQELHSAAVVVGRGEVRRSFFISPGCLCRTDGAVPSFHSGTSANGKPVTNHENWQQGLTIVTLTENANDPPQVEFVPINGGRALFRGRSYEAGTFTEPLREAQNEPT